jgi:hypothetical protein
MGRPYSPVSQKGAIQVFHVPLAKVRRVRCLLSTGRYMGHEDVNQDAAPTPVAVWLKREHPLALVIVDDLYRRLTCIHPIDYLALIRPVAARRVRLSRLAPRTLRCFVTLSEPLFIQTPDSPSDTCGFLLSFIVRTTLTSDFVSQSIFLSVSSCARSTCISSILRSV